MAAQMLEDKHDEIRQISEEIFRLERKQTQSQKQSQQHINTLKQKMAKDKHIESERRKYIQSIKAAQQESNDKSLKSIPIFIAKMPKSISIPKNGEHSKSKRNDNINNGDDTRGKQKANGKQKAVKRVFHNNNSDNMPYPKSLKLAENSKLKEGNENIKTNREQK